jgi:DNA-binding PadR family transcriptional regulator
MRAIRTTGLGYGIRVHQSQVYGELSRLAASGLAVVTQAGVRGRKEYRITESGREEIRTWLVVPDAERIVRYEPLLRVFFLWILEPAQRLEYLKSFALDAENFVEEFRKVKTTAHWDGSGVDHSSELALELATRIAEAAASWAEWAQTQSTLIGPLDDGVRSSPSP